MRGLSIRRSAQLLDALMPYGESLPYDSDEASLIRVARRDFEKAIKVPADYVTRAAAHSSASYDAWTRARPANDFATMRPFLEQALDLSREYAGFFAPYDHVADPLIDDMDQGMTTTSIRALFQACAASWCRSCAPYPSKRPPMIGVCAASLARARSLISASP